MRLASRILSIFSLTLAASGALGADLTEMRCKPCWPPRQPPHGRALPAARWPAWTFTVSIFPRSTTGADLSDADLRRTKLVGAKLVGAKLPRAKLNFAWIMRADFSHADLSGALLETLVVSAGMETLPDEAAKFVGANLSGAKLTARFSLDDMRDADLLTCGHPPTCTINPWV